MVFEKRREAADLYQLMRFYSIKICGGLLKKVKLSVWEASSGVKIVRITPTQKIPSTPASLYVFIRPAARRLFCGVESRLPLLIGERALLPSILPQHDVTSEKA
jgi:hypothetical protein